MLQFFCVNNLSSSFLFASVNKFLLFGGGGVGCLLKIHKNVWGVVIINGRRSVFWLKSRQSRQRPLYYLVGEYSAKKVAHNKKDFGCKKSKTIKLHPHPPPFSRQRRTFQINRKHIGKCEDHQPIAKSSVAKFLVIAQSQELHELLCQPIAKLIVAKDFCHKTFCN